MTGGAGFELNHGADGITIARVHAVMTQRPHVITQIQITGINVHDGAVTRLEFHLRCDPHTELNDGIGMEFGRIPSFGRVEPRETCGAVLPFVEINVGLIGAEMKRNPTGR